MNRSCNRGGLGAFEDLSQDMERVFDSLLGRTVGNILQPNTEGKFFPALDVSETSEAFFISVDLPGVKADNVELEVHDGKLKITGTRASATQFNEGEDSEKPKTTYHRVERNFGSFTRMVALPKDVDTDRIDASYTDGVLQIAIPKIEKPQPTKIQIRTA